MWNRLLKAERAASGIPIATVAEVDFSPGATWREHLGTLGDKWTVELGPADPDAGLTDGLPLWHDGMGLTLERLGPSTLRLRFDQVADAVVDTGKRTLSLCAANGALPQSTYEHLLLDQLLPRLRAHGGEFVIHAAVVQLAGGVILITGASGRGKSTLAAALDHRGSALIGDDAAVLDIADGELRAAATYSSLRLQPDSLAALYGTDRPSSPTAHYTPKRRLLPRVSARPDPGPLSCLGLFLLGDPADQDDLIRLSPVEPTRLCMELVRESFALDPSDTAKAAERLDVASRAATLIPAYELHYPRDYARLGAVCDTIIAAVAVGADA